MTRQADGSLTVSQKTRQFLPQFAREETSNYEARVKRSPFSDRFAQAIRDFIGMVFASGVRFSDDTPEMIRLHFQNLDNQGTTGHNLLQQMAIASMRRGHTFCLVDATTAPGVVSMADADRYRPYWCHIHAPQVLNWRHQTIGGQKFLTQLTFMRSLRLPDGEFGEKEEIVYTRLRPGVYESFRIEGVGKKAKALLLPKMSGLYGCYRAGRFEPLSFIPLVPLYGGADDEDSDDPFLSRPPLKSLADMNLTHYQTYSDHLNKVHKVCTPVYVRVGYLGEEDELVIGPDTTIDVPAGGGFTIVEPQANSLQQSRLELEALEVAMDFLGAQFLVKPGDRQAAMVSVIQAAKVESGLSLFTSAFTNGVNLALRVHAFYLGLPIAGSITLDPGLRTAQEGTDPNLLNAYSGMIERLLAMPPQYREILLKLIKSRGYLGDEFDVGETLTALNSVSMEVNHA